MANEFKIKKGLIVNGSGSTLLDIQGSQGQLFSVTDSLSGSLFSVNDISGMPILEAFSDDRVLIGTYNAEAIKVSGSSATITGSLLGTASYATQALSASYAPGGGSTFPFTGSALITGSLTVTGPVSVTGSLTQGDTNNKATGLRSHAEGSSTEATGSYSHAEGQSTIARGQSSHAEGYSTTAIGTAAHAEGNSTIASGDGSHAEGTSTEARGEYSHAEGLYTIAIGDYSHAEGEGTETRGEYSHAEGQYTIALGNYQHVQGRYNITSSAQSAFIHGNGTSDATRSNLLFASGSQVQVTGSVIATQGFTGSLFGTASFAVSSSRAISASYALTSSNVQGGLENYVPLWNTATSLTTSSIYQLSEFIGIGTTNPAYKLDVFSGRSRFGRGEHGYVFISDDGYGGELGVLTDQDEVLAIKYGGTFQYGGNLPGAAPLIVNASNVGIGTATPNAKLDVSGSAIVTGSLRVTQGITGSLFGSASFATQALSASYAISSSFAVSSSFAATASYVTPLNQTVIVTGSLRGNVISSSIASTTASFDLATSNFFTLTLANGANTHISASNILPGQTVNIRVTQGSAGTGTVSFNSAIKQSSGSLYTGSMIANAVDVVSLIAFDQTNAYISYINNFV